MNVSKVRLHSFRQIHQGAHNANCNNVYPEASLPCAQALAVYHFGLHEIASLPDDIFQIFQIVVCALLHFIIHDYVAVQLRNVLADENLRKMIKYVINHSQSCLACLADAVCNP